MIHINNSLIRPLSAMNHINNSLIRPLSAIIHIRIHHKRYNNYTDIEKHCNTVLNIIIIFDDSEFDIFLENPMSSAIESPNRKFPQDLDGRHLVTTVEYKYNYIIAY